MGNSVSEAHKGKRYDLKKKLKEEEMENKLESKFTLVCPLLGGPM